MIPTEYYDRLWIEAIILKKKYWWLRSPDTYFGNAWWVDPSGGVFYNGINVIYSYGRIISPGAVTNLDAFIITMTGDVSHAGNASIYIYSYGKLFKYL